jgi:hypothetical protein
MTASATAGSVFVNPSVMAGTVTAQIMAKNANHQTCV